MRCPVLRHFINALDLQILQESALPKVWRANTEAGLINLNILFENVLGTRCAAGSRRFFRSWQQFSRNAQLR